MANQQRTYLKLLLKGPPGFERALPDLQQDLELRHWEDLSITWNQQANGLVIETQFGSSKVDLIAKHFQEELFESACGVLTSVQGMRVEILDARLLPTD